MLQNDTDPAEIGAGTEPQAQQVNTDPLALYCTEAQALELLQRAELQADETTEPLRPLLRYIDGRSKETDTGTDYRAADFLCRGTLTMITGQKGSRKSTLVRALCFILLNGKLRGGIQGASPETLTALRPGLKIAVIDTEQHESRVQNSSNWLQSIYRQPQPFEERCEYYSGRGLNTDSLRDLCITICEHSRPDVLFLDVISHFVDDINDQKAAKFMVDFVNQICERYGVAVVGIIHQNPNKEATAADKMAGALGTKLLQAAEAVLHVARAQEGLQEVDADKNPRGFLYGRASVVTFAEYRERWPDITTILLRNENERGAYELSMQPVEIKNEQEKPGLPKMLRAFIQPARIVAKVAADIARAEAAALSPSLELKEQAPAAEPAADGEQVNSPGGLSLEEYNAVLQQANPLEAGADGEQEKDDLPF